MVGASDIYTEYFGLRERPFTLLPDPDFVFWSRGHRAAYTILEYGIVMRAPITVLTGEVGAGKTTLLQHLLNSIQDDTTIGLISNAQGDRGDLLRWVLNSFGIETGRDLDYVGMFQLLQDFLLGEYADGRRVIIVIDEAQNLTAEVLEELRMLTNINTNKDELLQLVLVGQPELRAKIVRPELSQFAQRVVASYHLLPMSEDTVSQYIKHRLKHAGGKGDEFTKEAVELVYQHTGGVPRLVNKLCDFAMVYAAMGEERSITETTVQQVISDGVFVTAITLTERAAE
ncbi:ExeA family protein [Actibacterium sp. 188UL27-1]|uniref:ExeA family protein n=1 Tax=Actibacterium sp. 188UL27-1 TaxID=2786961 RepID=UPI0019583F2A|nr:AAA family ATPase [Actibacterium sp. 188UL27-1]MBM7068986.1 AAA family ATPase [Actibacterium sp. 188UL27-1]